MKSLKPYLPIALALIFLALMNVNVFKQQQLIKTGKSIFVKLAPVDPRSLIQGDYMVLNYQLHWQDNTEDNNWDNESADTLFYSAKKTIKVTLDDDSVVIKSEPVTSGFTAKQHLLKVKSSDGRTYYPASNTFLFAEGLAYCYDKAEFAKFKVKANGSVLLHGLLGEKLEPLNCEAKARDKTEKLNIF